MLKTCASWLQAPETLESEGPTSIEDLLRLQQYTEAIVLNRQWRSPASHWLSLGVWGINVVLIVVVILRELSQDGFVLIKKTRVPRGVYFIPHATNSIIFGIAFFFCIMVPGTILAELVDMHSAYQLIPARDVLRLVIWIPIWSTCSGACVGSLLAVCAHITSVESNHAMYGLLHPLLMNTATFGPPLALTVGLVSFSALAGQQLTATVRQYQEFRDDVFKEVARGPALNPDAALRLFSESCSIWYNHAKAQRLLGWGRIYLASFVAVLAFALVPVGLMVLLALRSQMQSVETCGVLYRQQLTAAEVVIDSDGVVQPWNHLNSSLNLREKPCASNSSDQRLRYLRRTALAFIVYYVTFITGWLLIAAAYLSSGFRAWPKYLAGPQAVFASFKFLHGVHEWVPAAGALTLELMIAFRVFDPLNSSQRNNK